MRLHGTAFSQSSHSNLIRSLPAILVTEPLTTYNLMDLPLSVVTSILPIIGISSFVKVRNFTDDDSNFGCLLDFHNLFIVFSDIMDTTAPVSTCSVQTILLYHNVVGITLSSLVSTVNMEYMSSSSSDSCVNKLVSLLGHLYFKCLTFHIYIH